jgi:hypothetical protein
MTFCDSCNRHQWIVVNITFYLFALLFSVFAVEQMVEALHLKVSSSIPGGVIGMFYNPSGRTMALWLTEPLKEMSKCKG